MTEKCYSCFEIVEMIETSKDHFKCPKCGKTTWVIGKTLKEIRKGANLARLDAKHMKVRGLK